MKNVFNFKFKNTSSLNVYTFLEIEENKTVNDLLNEYLRKNNRPDFIDNYDQEFSFIFNSKKINSSKRIKIKDYFSIPEGNSIEIIEYNKF